MVGVFGPPRMASAVSLSSSSSTIVIGSPAAARRSAVCVATLAPSSRFAASAALIWSSVSKLLILTDTPCLANSLFFSAMRHGP